ncbi:MAG: UDP-N-acetylglucosamine 2-epimerase (hydrolyzing) [Betaproteobacteria bacterium]|nr:MAG: UDP-N-acetylglucosamine 2-epimerase (hydrolyzing) [Betaproteobacteria bacterium]
MSPRKICIVTGSRADYGLLYWPMRLIAEDDDFELQVVVTGMHLSPAFGETWRQIEADGFAIVSKVEMLLAGDSPVAVAKSVGLGVVGFADTFERLRPDLLMVLGDRFEIFAAVQAALFARIPVAHVCGGDITEGAFDESIRHAITKMAHVHFPTNAGAAGRLLAMGENPEHVHTVGSPGLDRIRRMTFMAREVFFDTLRVTPLARNLLVVFHPATLDCGDPLAQLEELLAALDTLGPEVGLLITGANADTAGQSINARLQAFAESHPNAAFRLSLGSELFINALQHVDAIVGNSSSGLYEAPSFGIPTVNIGDRQKGRLRAASVIDCALERHAIRTAIDNALTRGCLPPTVNPYGDGHTAERMLDILHLIPDFGCLIRKPFFDAMGVRS